MKKRFAINKGKKITGQNEVSRKEIEELQKNDPEALVDLVEKLFNRIEELEKRLQKDSGNSSKPPSSDMIRKEKPKNMRENSGRKPGGQKAHKGNTLELSSRPDTIINHKVVKCEECGKKLELEAVEKIEKRQVYEIPKIEISVEEHQAETKKCSCCGKINKAKFPEGITNVVQYGNRLKSFIVYFMNQQHIPYKRTQEIFEDIFGQKLSQGTLNNTNSIFYEMLEETEEKIKEALIQSGVIHLDESGLYVNKQRQWVHVSSTENLTYYEHHKKRGKEAIDTIGILPDYKGVAIHDFWQSYIGYSCKHGLCNAHHLRELKFIEEVEKQSWAKKMEELLLEIKKGREKKQEIGQERFTEIEIREFERRYHEIINEAFESNKPKEERKTEKKRGRKKQSKAKNLADRFLEYQREVLGYMCDFEIPFDNNQAERDIRMIKLQQKISGCFRSEKGAANFCRNRGYISTVKKQGLNVFQAIKSIFDGNPILEFTSE